MFEIQVRLPVSTNVLRGNVVYYSEYFICNFSKGLEICQILQFRSFVLKYLWEGLRLKVHILVLCICADERMFSVKYFPLLAHYWKMMTEIFQEYTWYIEVGFPWHPFPVGQGCRFRG